METAGRFGDSGWRQHWRQRDGSFVSFRESARSQIPPHPLSVGRFPSPQNPQTDANSPQIANCLRLWYAPPPGSAVRSGGSGGSLWPAGKERKSPLFRLNAPPNLEGRICSISCNLNTTFFKILISLIVRSTMNKVQIWWKKKSKNWRICLVSIWSDCYRMLEWKVVLWL